MNDAATGQARLDSGFRRNDGRAAVVYGEAMARHVLRTDHPMRPIRLQHTFELMQAYGLFDGDGAMLVEPREATLDELRTFHTEPYIAVVKALSGGDATTPPPGRPAGPPLRGPAGMFGFSDHGDNPVYPGMYEAALLSTGASVQAADLVADGAVRAAFAPAGGLHHAMAGNASGFCIFNDPVIAINALRKRGLRVVYVDIDAHHGDGVQAAFYRDKDVMTISTHESGRWLFPGTGDVAEMGEGEGVGYSVNLPLFPYTDDEVYLEAFEAVVPPLIKAFDPDVIATQLGADAYVNDPLTHLAITARGYAAAVERLGSLGYPWLAFGGGGYDLDAVPRCWTLALGVMLGRDLPDELPPGSERFLTSKRLREGESGVDDATRERARQWAQDQVEEIQRRIFLLHGIG